MEVRPLHDYVIIRRKEEQHVSQGGIAIPDTAAEKPLSGEVIAVGDGRVTPDGKVIPIAINVGDEVLFDKYSGTEIKLNNEELLAIRESEILAILGE